MGLRYFRPDSDEWLHRLLAGRESRNLVPADASIASVAQALASNQRYAPWMNGNAHLALARSGLNADDPEGRRVVEGAANLASRVRTKKQGWGPLGAIVGALGGVLGAVGSPVQAVSSATTGGGRASVRGLFTLFDIGTEAVDSIFREDVQKVREDGLGGLVERVSKRITPFGGLAELPGVLRETTAGIAAERALSGEHVDLGSGFFPGGEVREEQRQRAIGAGAIGDEAITPGRFLASLVSEPGTTPYRVVSGLTDFATDLYVDPAAIAGGQFAKARQARKLFDPVAAGGVRGLRDDVDTSVFDEWIASQPRVVEALRTKTDPIDIWRSTRKQVPLAVSSELADAATDDDVIDVLRRAAGGEIREKFTVDAFGARVSKSLADVRLVQQLPGRHVDPRRLDDVVEQAERFGRNARLPQEVLDSRLNEMVRKRGAIGRFQVMNRLLGDVSDHLVGQYGKSGTQGKQLTRMFGDYQRAMHKFFIDEVGHNAPVLGAVVDGNGFALPSPHLFVEYVDRALPLPDARAIRQATSRFAPLLTQKGIKTPAMVLDHLMNDVWKPLVLLRGAWTVRVVGEEQARMAGAGLDSVFRHPISAIAYVTGRKGGPLSGGDWGTDVDEFASALSRRGEGWRDRRAIHVGQKEVFRGEEDFARSWGDELAQLSADPIAKRVAGGWSPGDRVPGDLTGNHVDDVKRWFWEGPGKTFRLDMAEAKGREVLATSRADADAYVDSVFGRLRIKTGERPELIEAVGRGQLGDVPLSEVVNNRPRVNDSFAQRLSTLADEGVGPPVVKGDLTVATGRGGMGETYDKAVDSLFSFFMSRPTNRLSRSPSFRQFYWQRNKELMAFADPQTQQRILAQADEAGMGAKFRRELEVRAQAGAGELDLESVDLLSKGFALESTKGLLYDLSNRSQFFDATRLLFPFGEAWKEVLTTWGRMNIEQLGKPLRRIQQGVEGARGAGFFYTDPTSGEEVFNYPFSSFMNEKLLGYPAPFQGRVSGLNLVGSSVLPGLGPVVQIPVAKLLPNKPELDWIREVVIPFGDPQKGLTGIGGLVESQLPPWFQKVAKFNASPESDRAFGNTVGDVMAYLAQTGKYDLNTEDGLVQLETDAVSKARHLYAFRGFAQFFAPSAPKPLAVAMGENEDVVAADVLRKDYRRMLEEDPGTATETFLDKYGDGALLFMQGKTRAVRGGLPTTEESADWARANPELRERFPLTYGFFAPRNEDGEYDYAEMERQLRSGERESLTPAQMLRLANARVGRMVYERAKEKAEGHAEGREWLSDIRERLKDEYPGFGQTLGLRERAKLSDVMAEMEQAVDDPVLGETEAGRGIALYLRARARAMEALREDGLKTFGGKRATRYRDWLRRIGESISSEVPDFSDVFDTLLSQELKER